MQRIFLLYVLYLRFKKKILKKERERERGKEQWGREDEKEEGRHKSNKI